MPSFAAVMHNAPVLLVIDLIGVFVFALAGATAAVRQRLDLFGVLVLSFATATTGGILRDLLIGAVPRRRSPTTATWPRRCSPAWSPSSGIARSSACAIRCACSTPPGLGLFAVAGTQKALAAGLHPVMAALLGMLTGIGGGVMRDLLLSRVPVVFQSDIYALAALAGASVVVLGHWLHWPRDAHRDRRRVAVFWPAHPRHVVQLASAERASRRRQPSQGLSESC